jgi:SpoIID/LytB domain protein
LLSAGLLLSSAPPAGAYPSAAVELTGHGFGHGRGLGQWGALGYALDHGWDYTRILGHYYGGTTAGRLGADVPMTVQLTRFDGQVTAATHGRGQLQTSAASGSYAALRVRHVKANTFAVDRGSSCAGPWEPLAETSGPVTLSSLVASTENQADMVQACEPDGTRRWLRGDLQVLEAEGVARTVNRLGMEAYLRGVLPREVPASWGALGSGSGMHALRAQAVAARSYAQAERRSAFAKTCDTTSCQVYGGVAVQAPGAAIATLEHPNTDAAVRETSTEVRLLAGSVARTEFSSSTGGWTAGGTFPAVEDLGDTRSPNHNWSASVPVSTIESAFPQLGSLEAVNVTRRNGLGDGGGRVQEVVLQGSSGSVTRSGPQLRADFGLRSDWFFVANPPPPSPAWHLRNSSTTGAANVSFLYGDRGDVPLSCDWDGDGTSTPGIFRAGRFFLRNSNATGPADVSFFFGNPTDVPICGDWDGNGSDTIGVVRGGTWFLRNANTTGVANVSFGYGNPSDRPVTGDWDGNGSDTIGVVRGGTWFLRNANTTGVANVSFGYGNPSDRPVTGDWDANRTDSPGVVRGAG